MALHGDTKHMNVTKLDANIHKYSRYPKTDQKKEKNHKLRNGFRENVTKDVRTSNEGEEQTRQTLKGGGPVNRTSTINAENVHY